MTTIIIEYKPLGFLWRKRLETKFPARWSEMNPKQLAAIPLLQEGKLDEYKLLQIFLGIKKGIARRIDGYQRYCILRNINWIAEPEPYGTFIIKKILWFNSPAPLLKNVTFGAFIFGDTYYQNYLAGKYEDLNRFIACFYCDEKGFDENRIEDNAVIIRAIRANTREAIAINYALIREWLAKSYPYVFQKHEEGTKKEKSKGWVGVFDAVVGDDIANSEKYAQKSLSEIMRYLDRKTKDYYKHGSKV